jgi:2-keto-4-pentenoate hydratase/2-oxohepta-3-ene-1,7-dioic acid hydratase in catechol pathway
MRIVRFESSGRTDWGALRRDERVVPLSDGAPDLVAALDRPRSELESAAERGRGVPLAEVRLLAPIQPPRNVFCLGRNYAEHIREDPKAAQDLPPEPIWFTKATTTVVGPDSDVRVDPSLTSQLDWEVELAVVIGQGGKRIAEEHALDHVFGYTVLNDLSARDLQFARAGQWFLGKSLDGLCPIGPWIVSADEVPDPQALTLCLRVNDQERQHGSTAEMIFPIARAIADLSRGVTLLAGDVIATGTPSGIGMGRQPPEYLQHGDIVEAEVQGIGVLRNRILFEPQSSLGAS